MMTLVGSKIEIEFEDGKTEICEVIRVFRSNGDIKINRKGESRIELVTKYNEYHLRNPLKNSDGTKQYKWIDAYLKNSKSHKMVRVRGCGEDK